MRPWPNATGHSPDTDARCPGARIVVAEVSKVILLQGAVGPRRVRLSPQELRRLARLSAYTADGRSAGPLSGVQLAE